MTKIKDFFKKIITIIIRTWTGGVYGEATKKALENNIQALENNIQVMTALAMSQLEIIRNTSLSNTIMQLQIMFIKEQGLERRYKTFMKKNGYKIEKQEIKGSPKNSNHAPPQN